MAKLTVLYPQPTDVEKFNADYVEHVALLHQNTGIPTTEKPYTVSTFVATPEGTPPYYRMFIMPFDSLEALQTTMASPAMQEVVADAFRISTGGPLTILIAGEE